MMLKRRGRSDPGLAELALGPNAGVQGRIWLPARRNCRPRFWSRCCLLLAPRGVVEGGGAAARLSNSAARPAAISLVKVLRAVGARSRAPLIQSASQLQIQYQNQLQKSVAEGLEPARVG